MKRILIFPILALVLVSGIVVWFYLNSQPPSNSSTEGDFLVLRGASASSIGEKLAKEGFIKNPLAFKLYVQLTARQKAIQAGEHTINKNYSLFQVVTALTKGPKEIWVTVPEGLRREEVAEKFVSAFNKKGQDAQDFRQEFLNDSSTKEGYLFPDTYLFPKTASPSAIVGRMLSIFDLRVDTKMRADIAKTQYNLGQIITMASLVERETKTDQERPIVAGILFKRLEKGWPLEVDAGLQYAVSSAKCRGEIDCKWWEPPTADDKMINSAYNLYKFSSLPPGPIANPGLSSIKAAIYPEDSPYWFYIHDANGQIHYARTLEEHNQNVAKYLGE